MPPSETNKAPTTDPKEMEISELLDKEPRIILLEKFTELQEHSYRQLNKTGKIDCPKKKKKKVLKLKNTTELKK